MIKELERVIDWLEAHPWFTVALCVVSWVISFSCWATLILMGVE